LKRNSRAGGIIGISKEFYLFKKTRSFLKVVSFNFTILIFYLNSQGGQTSVDQSSVMIFEEMKIVCAFFVFLFLFLVRELISLLIPRYQNVQNVGERKDFDLYFVKKNWHFINEFAAYFDLTKQLLTGLYIADSERGLPDWGWWN
jgi:hypothetical protein